MRRLLRRDERGAAVIEMAFALPAPLPAHAALAAAARRHPFAAPAKRRPVAPLVLRAPGGDLRFLSLIAHFGTSEDVVVRDLRLELFFPADDYTRAAMAAFAASSTAPSAPDLSPSSGGVM